MKPHLLMLALTAALARGAWAETFRATEGDIGRAPLPLHAFDLGDEPSLVPDTAGLQDAVRQPRATATFGAMLPAAPRAALHPPRTGSLESENMLGFFSPAGVGGIFYLVAIVLGFYYRWLFQRTRERGRFVTQRATAATT